MPKRGAEEYITKEHGSVANSDSGQEKPKMSTAAQLARRKIAVPKGRLNANRTSQNPPLGIGSANPFGKDAPQQTFSNINGGISFGASQSFPPDPSGTNTGFNFQPPQSSTFTFGAPSSTPNPFVSLNGTGDAPNTQQPDISMESPQKKPAFGNAFGSNNTTNTMGSGFTFAQTPQKQSNGPFTFGLNQTANESTGSSGGGLFGRTSKPEDSQPLNNPFGPPSKSQPSFTGFGQPASTPQSPASSFTFGQDTSTAAASTSAPSFGFGQSTSVPQSPLPSFGGGDAIGTKSSTEPPKLAFGQSSTTAHGQASASSFGATSNTTGSSNIFGSGNAGSGQTPSVAFGSSTASNPFPFGQSQPASTQSNAFSSFGAAKSDETKAASSLFGSSATTPQPAAETQRRSASPAKSSAPSSSGATTEASTNPFADLFAGAGTPPIAPVSKPTFSFSTTSNPAGSFDANTLPAASPAPKPTFTFGTTTKPASTSEATDATQTAPAPTPTFSFGGASQVSKPGEAGSAPASKTPSFFGTTNQPSTQSARAVEPQPSEPKPSSGFAFGHQSASSDKPGDASKPVSSGGLFSPAKNTTNGASNQQNMSNLFSTTPKPTADTSNKPAGAAATQPSSIPSSVDRLGQAQTQQAQSAQNLIRSKPSSEKSNLFQSSSTNQDQIMGGDVDQSLSASEPVKRPVYTKAPPFIPSHLDAERFREYDRNYRLHSLNAGLQKKLASLDPRSHDFDNLVRHYVAARDSIGASLGMYTRNVAGTKRKGDRIDVNNEGHVQNKRTRSDNSQQVSAQSKPTVASFDTGIACQGPGFALSPAPNNPVQEAGSSKATKATAQLNEMIPAASSNTTAGHSEQAGQDTNSFSLKATHSITSASSTTPTKSPPKMPTFEVPKLVGGNINFMNAFGQKAKENAEKFEQSLIEKRKAEDFDSDEDDEEAFRKQAEEEMQAKRAKIDAIAKAGFTPTFGSGNKSPPKPLFNFGSKSEGAKNPESSRPAFSAFTATAASPNPFAALNSTDTSGDQSQQGDDEEDDDSESNRSIKDGAEGGDEEGSESSDDNDEEGEHDHQGDEALEDQEENDGDDNDFQAALDRSRKHSNTGKSLFERIEPNPTMKNGAFTNGDTKDSGSESSPVLQPAKNSSFPPSVWGSHIGKSTPEAPTFSPLTPAAGATKSTYKPSATFSFTPTAPNTTSTPTPGASIFAGGLTKGGPVPGEGLFGSRPSTPSNVEKNSNLAKSILTSPPGTDNTWKAGGPISFANGEKNQNAPTFQFTAPSPGEKDSSTQKPFGSLFGTPSTASKDTETTNQVGFQFGVPVPIPAPGFLGAISHLGGGSGTSSAGSSRATSPGTTDNESVATNETDETPEDTQAASLMESRAGEENESCLWEGRSKALMFVNEEMAEGTKLAANDWNSMGVGQIRVLKDNTTGKTRVVFRVEPNANILINSHLVEGVTYENIPSTKSGAVRGALIYKGNLVRWVFKVKSPDMAIELAKFLEDNKKASV
ncbi:hypothetical protein A1O3_04287 [Capronia epimyces CBS 606.96]|uniref:RanBD1 domain-containing protein n=1 Tax=Capronia epimyces CBS 606.96 TaxID=1182542 RepID=W9Y4B6_9EURO|nr:uncharacterized protein A1O3_04287 [Capronia epimyces CBS 606.96]EXJ87328.1 hypothetical protein A1O3_04287 [Capronia epimyces CBS 606.96]